MRALYDSLVRTYVPWIAGIVIGWLVSLGVPLDPEVAPQVTAVLMLAASILWYLLARIFEIYVHPKLGWLIGLPKQPLYERTSKPDTTVPTIDPAQIRADTIALGRVSADNLEQSFGEELDITSGQSTTTE